MIQRSLDQIYAQFLGQILTPNDNFVQKHHKTQKPGRSCCERGTVDGSAGSPRKTTLHSRRGWRATATPKNETRPERQGIPEGPSGGLSLASPRGPSCCRRTSSASLPATQHTPPVSGCGRAANSSRHRIMPDRCCSGCCGCCGGVDSRCGPDLRFLIVSSRIFFWCSSSSSVS